jgi:hypothetical protein
MTTLVSIAALAATLASPDSTTADCARTDAAAGLLDAPAAVQADGASYLSIHVGRRSLDEDDWAPIDDPPAIAFEFARVPDSGLGWEVGLGLSYDEEDLGAFDFDATILELYGGARADLAGPGAVVVPYLGLGLSIAVVESSGSSGSSSVSDDDATFGFYAHGGIAVPIGDNLRIGADVRGLFGTDVELFGVAADVDYAQVTIFIAFGV